MTRKQLPKAIRKTSHELRAIAGGPTHDEEAPAPQSALPHDAVKAGSAAAASAPPAEKSLLPAAPNSAERWAAGRRSAARKIVERHRTYAAVGGLFPLPVVNIAGVTAINMRMVKQLSDLYGVPFERDRTRSMIIGLMGGAVPTGLGAATASTLVFVVPGSALFGLAVSAISAGALTRGIGLVFLEHFENESMSLDIAKSSKPE
jgi:uncharacterized protein (DUF697 family)